MAPELDLRVGPPFLVASRHLQVLRTRNGAPIFEYPRQEGPGLQ